MVRSNRKIIEESDSRTKWEKADPETRRRAVAAITKKMGPVPLRVVRVLALAGTFLPLAVLICVLIEFVRNPDILPAFIIIAVWAIIMFSYFMFRYVKYRPYLYPEKMPDIWLARAKCVSLFPHILRTTHYLANFQKGGRPFTVEVSPKAYNPDFVGAEYIFYKYNEKKGNRWIAFEAALLDVEE